MNKLIGLIQNYLIFGFPLVVGFFIFAYLVHIDSNATETILRNILSFNLLIWFGALCAFLIFLIILPSVRESTIRRLANLKERDEREQYITGQAARAAYIASLSMMIFLFFVSIIQVSIRPIIMPSVQQSMITESHLLQNKTSNVLDIGLDFHFFEKSENTPSTAFSTNNFKLTSSATILILVIWQLLIFNLAARNKRWS